MNYNRSYSKCSYNCIEQHSLRNCPLYKNYKDKTNEYMYIDIKLHNKDETGFCAAGIFLFYRHNNNTYFLMLKEYRKKTGEYGYNLPAGGRETKSNNSFYLNETSKETAISEFYEEIGLHIKNLDSIINNLDNSTFVLWNGKSKYVLYFLEIDPSLSSLFSHTSLKWFNLNYIDFNLINKFNIPIIKFILKFKSTLNL